MTRRDLLFAVAGGVVLFLWGGVSHALLPFHGWAYEAFADEEAIARVLNENAAISGLYFVPFADEEQTPDRVRALVNVLLPGEGRPIWMQVTAGLIGQVVAMLFAIKLLLPGVSGASRAVPKFALLGFLIGFSSQFFYWNWFGFPALYAAVMIGDSIIGWSLAGLAVEALIRRHPG